MNTWSSTLQEFIGDSNAGLRARQYGYQFSAAVELVRDYRGWFAFDFNTFKNRMLTNFYPINSDVLIRPDYQFKLALRKTSSRRAILLMLHFI